MQKTVSPARGHSPQALQMDSVVLGLQQLERQQVEQEQKRLARTVPPPSPHDSSDDSTAPSSTQNSNTADVLDPGPTESSFGRFLRVSRLCHCSSFSLATTDYILTIPLLLA